MSTVFDGTAVPSPFAVIAFTQSGIPLLLASRARLLL